MSRPTARVIIIAITSLAFVALVGGLMNCAKRRQDSSSSDRRENAASTVAQCIDNYYWHTSKLPKNMDDLVPYLNQYPEAWQPLRSWRVTWKTTGALEPDSEYGGNLSVIEVRLAPPGEAEIVEKIPIDLRDPMQVWKPHYMCKVPMGKRLQKKDRADQLAEAIYEYYRSSSSAPPPQASDLAAEFYRPQSEPQKILAEFNYSITKTQIVINSKDESFTRNYPRSGPPTVNNLIKPLVVNGQQSL